MPSNCQDASPHQNRRLQIIRPAQLQIRSPCGDLQTPSGRGQAAGDNSRWSQIGAVVTSELCMHFPEGCGVDIIAEPGRFYVTSAFTAALNVIAKKNIVENSGGNNSTRKRIMYYLNDGTFGSFIFLLFEENHLKPLVMHKAYLAQPLYPSTLWGQTLDGSDKIMDDVALPELQIGDWLVFRNMGAYSVSTTTLFTAFTAMPIYFLLHRDAWTALGDPGTPFKK